jgi:hypothetical protein
MELVLSIDLVEEPPSGEILCPGATPRSFAGWLELLRCLSDLVCSARGELAAGGLEGELDAGDQPEL